MIFKYVAAQFYDTLCWLQLWCILRDVNWPNDGCTANNECCSGKCELLHPGTNPTCARSSMWQPCLSGFHCDSRLKCGLDHVCCSGTGERVQIRRIVVRTITWVEKWKDLYTKSVFHVPEHYYFQGIMARLDTNKSCIRQIHRLYALYQCS